MKKKIISIIVPMYNVEQYIEQCMNSIINQTIFNSIQVIVVNDGSTDNSLSICENIASKFDNIHVYSKKNEGVSEARNFGMEKADTKYVAFLDADDYIDNNLFEWLLTKVEETSSDVAMVDFNYIDINSKIKRYTEGKCVLFNDSNSAIIDFLMAKNIQCYVFAKLFKRTVIEDIVFPKEYTFSEDVYFIYEALKKSSKVVVDNTVALYNYVQRGSSITHRKFSENNLSSKLIAESIIHDSNSIVKPYAEIYKVMINCELIEQIYINKNKDYYNTAQTLLDEVKNFSIIKYYSYLPKRKLYRLLLMKISPKLYIYIKNKERYVYNASRKN